jgi:hypothetical protein
MPTSRVVLDVTSFTSAEEFVLSRNRGETALDPFARSSAPGARATRSSNLINIAANG